MRYVVVDGVEVLRGIAFLVRDRDWATLAANHEDPVVDEAEGRVRLAWRSRVEGLAWTTRIEADASGLRYEAAATASADIEVNRVGCVVLHPLDGFAGADVEVEHTDGTRETVTIPHAIAPHQPAFDIAALTHRVAGLSVRVAMAGDAFEMEDQRNWTDASFKTYVRPLSRPRPFTVRDGEALSQTVRLSVTGTANPAAVVPAATAGTMPAIALTAEAADLPALASVLDLLRPAWLHLRAGAADAGAVASAQALGLPVLLDLLVGSAGELAAFAGVRVAALVLCGDEPDLLAAARAHCPGIPVGVGVRTHFTELNRARPAADAAVLVHATSAIVHAADDRSVLETLDALPHVFASARLLAPGAAYRPGPCTIGDVTGPAANQRGELVPASRHDPRHTAPFAAAWAVGVLAAAARGGAASISLGTASGDFALLTNGRPTPLGHLARAAAALAGRPVTTGRDRIEGDGFCLRANLTATSIQLDEEMTALGPNGWTAARSLGPYGMARSGAWPDDRA